MAELKNKIGLSVNFKINLVISVIFLVVIVAVTYSSIQNEKERVLINATERTKEVTNFYFDSLNTMMITQTMGQRDVLRKKINQHKNILEARVIRGQPVIDQYGPGGESEKPQDALDHRALKGEEIIKVDLMDDGGRSVTVITPFFASKDKYDVNCLTCHVGPEGSVNGAIRVTYSLAETDRIVESGQRINVLISAVLFFIGLFIANIVLRSWITNPLSQLISVVRQRAEGDLNVRAEINSNDEIGQLAQTFNLMSDANDEASERERETTADIRRKVDLMLDVVNKAAQGDLSGKVGFSSDDSIGELGSGLQAMINNLNTMVEEKQEDVEEVKLKVETILTVVQAAAQGDLTGKIALQGSDELSHLAQGVQSMIDSLKELTTQVQHSCIKVTSSTTEIAASSRQHEATMSTQVDSVNDIVTTATEISATAKELLTTMHDVADVAVNTAQAASKGQEGLDRMGVTMKNVVDAASTIASKLEVLSNKASNIGTVVTTIAKVADQTNLLSLNAAIEAEKAGEYGAGFSVVATEMRRLADQTAVATWDIEQMIKEIQSAVSAGVMSVDKFSEQVRRSVSDVQGIGDELGQIIEQVQALTPRFESVHEGMQFQAQGADQINQSMIQLSDSSHQTLESIRQANESILSLNDAAHELQNSVSRLKVGD